MDGFGGGRRERERDGRGRVVRWFVRSEGGGGVTVSSLDTRNGCGQGGRDLLRRLCPCGCISSVSPIFLILVEGVNGRFIRPCQKHYFSLFYIIDYIVRRIKFKYRYENE